jgi:SAM-dependent methyltransferase
LSETDGQPGRPREWRSYYEKTGTRPPRKTLIHALDRFEAEGRPPGFALDLGCGSGRDTIEILRRCWPVLAIDAEQSAIEALSARDDLPDGARLETRVARFEETTLPAADLINSAFALPLCTPPAFADLWQRILDRLRPGGRFSGQLFGTNDSWVGNPTITFLTRPEAEALLAPLTVEMFDEEEDDSVTPWGSEKHWHIFHIVARKEE